MKVKQKNISGSIVEIPLGNRKFAFARIMGEQIAVYDLIIAENERNSKITFIIQQPILFYVIIYDSVITKGHLKIIGFVKLSQEEIYKIPPNFNQDSININDCVIFHLDARFPPYKASAEDCIGLENATLYDFKDLKDRVEDFYSGIKNNFAEYDKVILSADDERYNDGYK